MERQKTSPTLKYLVGYYGVLQSLHLISLARAGLITLRTGQLPFPAAPPVGGWPESSLPFLLGMGVVDVAAIILGLIFVYRLLFQGYLSESLGLISLTIALVSGVLYLIGTLPSGAWQANLAGYLIVLVVFSPVIPLIFVLLNVIENK